MQGLGGGGGAGCGDPDRADLLVIDLSTFHPFLTSPPQPYAQAVESDIRQPVKTPKRHDIGEVKQKLTQRYRW